MQPFRQVDDTHASIQDLTKYISSYSLVHDNDTSSRSDILLPKVCSRHG